LPQFLNSHLTGLWNGKNNGDLQVKVQQGQTGWEKKNKKIT